MTAISRFFPVQAPISLGSRQHRRDSGLLTGENLIARVIAAISDGRQLLNPHCLTSLLCHRGKLMAVTTGIDDIVCDDEVMFSVHSGLDVVADDELLNWRKRGFIQPVLYGFNYLC